MLEDLIKKGGLQQLVNKRRDCSKSSKCSSSNQSQNKKTNGYGGPDDEPLQGVQKKLLPPAATAIPATVATERPQKPESVAKVATVAVAGGTKTKKQAHHGHVDDWLASLQNMLPVAASEDQSEHVERLIDLTARHGQAAADMGWSAVELYGVAPHVRRPSIQRKDCNGLFVGIAVSVHNYRIETIGTDSVILITQTGARHNNPRQRAGLAEAVPIWELVKGA